MAEDLGERTEDATPRRRQQAREEGNVAKSQDLAAALMLLLITLAMWPATGMVLGDFKSMMAASLDGGILGAPERTDTLMPSVTWLATHTARAAIPLLLIAWVAAFLVHFVQVGWLFAPKKLEPSLNKLNPITGFKRIFGLSALVKAGLDSAKVLVVVVVAVFTIHSYVHEIGVLPYLTAWQGWGRIGAILLDLALRVIGVLLLLGLIDFTYQKWKHSQDLKMSKHEVKEEMKQTEGDPETRKRRARMQQQIAMQRIGAAVPKADVVVTNPEHISIALQYDAEAMSAPRVVAKGADFLALRIRQIALQHDIPIVERKPLARALYRSVEVGQEIPPEFYKAVAEILAYVYQLGGRKAG